MNTPDALLRTVAAAWVAGSLDGAAIDNLKLWLAHEAFASYRADVEALLAGADWPAIQDAFGDVLPFGTAGRRGTEGAGPNRINERTIAETAAGLADCVREALPGEEPTCVVACDARRRSRAYAELCAEALAARGCRVLLFDGPAATPMLAYTVLARGASCGLMITASHNPPEYNGIKAYWRHGGQVVPPHDEAIIDAGQALQRAVIDRLPLADAVAKGHVSVLGPDADEDYWHYVAGQALDTARDAVIAYSPLEGVGMRCVAPVLERAGFTGVHVVASQAEPSSEFANVPAGIANPEVPKAMGQVLALCREVGADAGIASDPDADRIGLYARDPDSPEGYRFITGQQIGVLVAWLACEGLRRRCKLIGGRSTVLKTAVTNELVSRVAESYGVTVVGDLPVGFRWMGEVLDVGMDDGDLVVAVEESHGVNRGGRVRDKDAASAALALCELTARLKAEGRSIPQLLDELYLRHGYHHEWLHNETMADRRAMRRLLNNLREHPPAKIGGLKVESHEDRLRDGWANPCSGRVEREDFIIYHLAGDGRVDGVRLAMRPSGTEPKLKIYALGHRQVRGDALPTVKAQVAEVVNALPRTLLDLAGG
ncbi:MAG: phospho-sugar mutase [Armatimonadetes bacterium]|nr:phospho-sugar mutase [Armatimonadota bacterium]